VLLIEYQILVLLVLIKRKYFEKIHQDDLFDVDIFQLF